MSTQFKISGSLLASAAAFALLAVSPASATLIQTQTDNSVSGSASLTAHQTGVGSTTTSATNQTLATKQFSQFDTTNGVLTGAKVTIDGGRRETAVLSASGGVGGARRADGSGTNTNTSLSAPGISLSFGNIGIANFRCQPNGIPLKCPRTVGPIPTATSGNASTSNLAALSGYAGNGNVTVNLLGNLSATALIENTTTGGPNAPYTDAWLQNTVGWSGKMSLEYDYLAHANPSFSSINDVDVLNIDFGTVLQNSSPAAQNFAITNLFATLLASDTVGLDLDLITGPNSPFSLTGSTFSDLLAGLTSGTFSVNFDTSNVGNFSDTILLSLSDADAGVGMQNYTLTVNLNGVVQAPTRSVPEPASIALLGAGLLGAGGLSRRKVRKAS